MTAATPPAPVSIGRADPYAPRGLGLTLESAGAILLAILWFLPLAYAAWAAFHPSEYTTRFVLTAPLTLDNFARAWVAAPFPRYFLNTVVLVTLILVCQLVLGTLAAYALARQSFVDTLTLYLHGICCDIDVDTGPRQLPSRYLRKRLVLLEEVYPPPKGYAVFPEELTA